MSSANAVETKMIPLSEPSLEGNTWEYVKDALDSGWVSSVGPYVDEFERRMAAYHQVPRTVATMNGTAALHIALILAGVGEGDEVIVPSLTFIASINAIRYVGAHPVFWDSSNDHWNGDVQALECLITPKTKAIMAVHLYGHPLDMTTVLSVANAHGIKVIEDAAEALGASWNGQACGTMGDLGCLSFNGNKTLTTGGGGLIMSQDETLMARAHYLINQAKDDALSFRHDEVGYNYRLTNLQAALGVAQLEQLPVFLARRCAIVDRYNNAFEKVSAIHKFVVPAQGVSSNWLYGIALKPEMLSSKTALDLVHALSSEQIQARPFFKPGHQQKPFQPFVTENLPNADYWHAYGINLPSSSTLTPDDQDRVIAAVLSQLSEWGAEV